MESKGDSPLQKEVKNVWHGEEEEVQCEFCKKSWHHAKAFKLADLPMMREYLTHLHRPDQQKGRGGM